MCTIAWLAMVRFPICSCWLGCYERTIVQENHGNTALRLPAVYPVLNDRMCSVLLYLPSLRENGGTGPEFNVCVTYSFNGGLKITMNDNRSLNLFFHNANTDTTIDTALRVLYVLDRPGTFPDRTAFHLSGVNPFRDWNYTAGVRWYFHPRDSLYTNCVVSS